MKIIIPMELCLVEDVSPSQLHKLRFKFNFWIPVGFKFRCVQI